MTTSRGQRFAILPVELDVLIRRVDLANYWAPKTTDTSVTERRAAGFHVCGANKADWLWRGVGSTLLIGDVAVRVATVIEGTSGAYITLWFRTFTIDTVEVGYGVTVHPQLRRYRLFRHAGSATAAILDWTQTDDIAAKSNIVEARVLGHRIVLVVNGVMLASVQDGSFGRGDALIGIGGAAPGDALLIESLELYSVRAGRPDD